MPSHLTYLVRYANAVPELNHTDSGYIPRCNLTLHSIYPELNGTFMGVIVRRHTSFTHHNQYHERTVEDFLKSDKKHECCDDVISQYKEKIQTAYSRITDMSINTLDLIHDMRLLAVGLMLSKSCMTLSLCDRFVNYIPAYFHVDEITEFVDRELASVSDIKVNPIFDYEEILGESDIIYDTTLIKTKCNKYGPDYFGFNQIAGYVALHYVNTGVFINTAIMWNFHQGKKYTIDLSGFTADERIKLVDNLREIAQRNT